MKRILFLISLCVLVSEVQAQKRAVPSNPFSQTLKALQAERLHNENLKAQKAPSLDKLLSFRKISFAQIENILTNEGWRYISGENNDGTGMAIFAYNTTIDNKAWYKLKIGYAEEIKQTFGNYIYFEHDSKLINKLTNSRLAELGYQLKSITTAEDGIVKFFYNSANNTFVILSSENIGTGYGLQTNYTTFTGLCDPAKSDSIRSLPTIKN